MGGGLPTGGEHPPLDGGASFKDDLIFKDKQELWPRGNSACCLK